MKKINMDIFISYTLSLATVILGGLILFSLINIKGNLAGVFVSYTLALLSGLFLFFCGGWIFLSIYAKYLFAGLFVILAVISVRRLMYREIENYEGAVNLHQDSMRVKIFKYVWKTPLVVIFVFLNYAYFTSSSYPEPVINLEFPFRNGTFAIVQGGSNKFINPVHNESSSYSIYAFDIVKLNKYGSRANELRPVENENYEIFGERIFSPVNGTVVAIKKEVADNFPGEVNPAEKAGNFVVIQSGQTFVMVAHMKQGSVTVKMNDKVKTGAMLGEIGNSGNSLEPHLHIEAHETNYQGNFPVSIFFGGKPYTYNDIIRN